MAGSAAGLKKKKPRDSLIQECSSQTVAEALALHRACTSTYPECFVYGA